MAEITRRRTVDPLHWWFSILMAAPEVLRASNALQVPATRFTLPLRSILFLAPGG